MGKQDLGIISIVFVSISILVFPLLYIANLLNHDTVMTTVMTIGNTIVYLFSISILITSQIFYYLRKNRHAVIYNVQKVLNRIRVVILICGLLLFPYFFESTPYIFGWLLLILSMSDLIYGHSLLINGDRVEYSNDKSLKSHIILNYSNVGKSAIELHLENGTKKIISFSKNEMEIMDVLKNKLDDYDAI